ncbi:MAG: methyltransferase domain-containing protein [Treponema sp.]|nr:methyltransferase domain-containing protein [Treponema sp.]
MDDNKKFWQKTAKIYSLFTRGSSAGNRMYAQIESEIQQQLTKEMHVLELAAGPGILSSKIAEACGSLVVTDFSTEMLALAEKRVAQPNVTFAAADATCLQYDDKTFDAVVIANALHIMPQPEKAASEIKRVLKDGGLLIAPTFTRESMKPKLTERFMEIAGFRTYSRWTHEAFSEWLALQGFTVTYSSVIAGDTFPVSFAVCRKNLNNFKE